MQQKKETVGLQLAFARDVEEDDIRAREFYCALCGNRWENQNKQVLELSWRQAGEFVASIRNRRFHAQEETYLDYYASGGEGTVAPWVRSRFRSLGYELSEGP